MCIWSAGLGERAGGPEAVRSHWEQGESVFHCILMAPPSYAANGKMVVMKERHVPNSLLAS